MVDRCTPNGPCVPAGVAGSRTRINADIPSTGASPAASCSAVSAGSPAEVSAWVWTTGLCVAAALESTDRCTGAPAGGAGPLRRSRAGWDSGTLCSDDVSLAGTPCVVGVEDADGAVDDPIVGTVGTVGLVGTAGVLGEKDDGPDDVGGGRQTPATVSGRAPRQIVARVTARPSGGRARVLRRLILTRGRRMRRRTGAVAEQRGDIVVRRPTSRLMRSALTRFTRMIVARVIVVGVILTRMIVIGVVGGLNGRARPRDLRHAARRWAWRTGMWSADPGKSVTTGRGVAVSCTGAEREGGGRRRRVGGSAAELAHGRVDGGCGRLFRRQRRRGGPGRRGRSRLVVGEPHDRREQALDRGVDR